jgi:putative radical SAM enzyme (TIGR03279 family)
LLEIINVLPGSTASRLGLKPGDAVVSINGEEIHDVIDFSFFAADEQLSLAVQNKSGSIKKLKVNKEPDDNLGLEFAPFRIKRCRNKCLFCFVDQMPPGCRKTLYVKDDDFRASFLHGNFITLGALSESDWEKIFRLRLSPLYVSVHTTDAGLRASVLRNTKAPDILESLKRLASGGIKMHTQVVLCPEVNDEEHLKRTIIDLGGLFPAVCSIAVVPVGITKFREGLFPLRTFSRQEARAVLKLIEPFARGFKKRFGTRLVFASDEFYIKANEHFPPSLSYEDFPQIENGVGLVATFLGEVSRTRLPATIPPVKATVVTGVSFSKILSNVLKRVRGIKGTAVKQVTVKNRFFGPSVTVAGLLTGGDILHALKGKRLGDMVLIPSSALKEDVDVFLDDMSVEELERHLKTKVSRVDGFKDLVAVLRGRGRGKQ